MSALKFEKSDVIIYDIKITNASGDDTKDIRGQVLTLSVYEDMEEPTIFAEILIRDEIDLITKLPIIGEEEIEISFKTPTREEITTYKLRVFNITASEISLNNKGSTYKLECVSIEHFLGSSVNIEKTYKDLISNMVNDILVNIIKSNRQLDIETTRGIVPFAMPRIKAFPAIDMLRQRAISMAPTGGVFVFFQNQSGIIFKSIETLMEESKKTIESRVFTYSPTTNTDADRETFGFRNLINFSHLKKSNNVDKIKLGLFNNSTKSYDLLTKSYDNTEFKLNEQSNRIVTGQTTGSKLPNSPNFIDSFSSIAQNKFFVTKDTSKGNEYISNFLSFKQAYAALFNQNIVRAFAHGDNYLKVGDMVTLNLPEASAIKKSDVEDPTFAGNYLITKLRHLIYIEEGKFKHRVSFDCNKIG